jgi:hypothetical protein
MQLYVDDRRTETESAGTARLSQLLDEIKRRSGSVGRTIVAIACDGIDITGETFASTLAKPVADFQRIDMHTAEPQVLVAQALATAEELLNASHQATQEAVELLAQGKSSAALPRLAECCQAWLKIHEGITNAIAMLNIDPAGLEAGGRKLPALMTEPLDRLRQLRDALTAGDHVLLGDMLTYEFPGAISAWRTLIRAVAAHVQAPVAPVV